MQGEMLRKLYLKAGLNGLPTAALAVFALTSWSWLGYLLCLVTIGYGWELYRLDGLGKQRLARVMVIASVLLESARLREGGLAAPLAITGVLLAGLVAHEPMLTKALMTGKLRTVNLGVSRNLTDRILDPEWAYLVTSVLTVVYLGCAAFSVPAWPLAAITILVTLSFFVAVLAAWRERQSEAHQLDAEVHAAVEKVDPKFMVQFSAPAGSEYQLLMWLPYLDRLGEPYVIVLREPHSLPVLAKATDRPIVVAPSIGNLEHMLVDSMRAVFYVNNGMKNTHCVRFGQLTHVQMLHGDSDKPSSYNPITAMYDRIYVAGQAGIDRYHKNGIPIPVSQFRIVGRPQVADVAVSTRDISTVEHPTVLYAPTWTGNSSDVNYSSLAIGEKIIRGLIQRGATVILRAHPYTTRNPASAQRLGALERLLADDASRTGRRHRWGKAADSAMSLLDCINTADALISDVSAVASDWLYSEKPFATTDMQGEGEDFAVTFPLSQASYVLGPKAGNLDQVLEELLHTDTLAPTRRDMKTYYLGDFADHRYVDGFLDEARRCVAGRDEVRAALSPPPEATVA